MKKLLLVFTIAGFAVACGNKSEEKTEQKDTTTVVQPPIDTTTVRDTTVIGDTSRPQ